MNKLINDYNRGFSLKNDDLRFIDASVRLALADIAAVFANSDTQACILWGCKITLAETTFSISEGAIFYNEEVWHVYAHTLTMSQPLIEETFWCFRTANAAAGAKLDKDLVSHQAYQVRDCILQLTETGTGIIASAAYYLTLQASDLIAGVSQASVTIPSGSYMVSSFPFFARKANGLCTLTGQINLTNLTTAGTIAFTLLSGYLPVCPVSGYLPACSITGTVIAQVRYELNTGGQFKLWAPDVALSNVYVYIGIQSFVVA